LENYNMIYIQLIGIIAFLLLVLSYYNKKPVTILLYQVAANFAYAVHYFLLGGLSGAFTSIIGIFRNIALIKLKSMESKKLLAVLVILCYLCITLVFYENYYSIFPMFANSTYLFIMLKGSRKALIVGGIVSSVFWLMYAIFELSYAGMLTETIVIVSNAIQLLKLRKSLNNV